MTIITQQLANKLPPNNVLLSNQVINPLDYSGLHSAISGAKELTIYDVTYNEKLPDGKIISVRDHINRTGNNPLINHQNKLNIEFIDITRLYKFEQNSVKTNCCGKKLNRTYPHPSHYLCNISILAKALGINKISAFLVNSL